MKAYLPHLSFVDPARRSSALLHTLVGFCAIEFFYGICRDALDYVAYNLIPEEVSPFLDPDSAAGLLYDLYSFRVLPALGQVVARDRESYQYLVESIRQFPPQDELLDLIGAAGLEQASYRNLSGGIAALHSAWRI